MQKKSNNLQLKLQANQSKINQYKISLDQIENLSKELCARIEKLHHESNNYDQNSLLTEILLLEKKLHLEETAAQAKHQELLSIKDKIQTKKIIIKNLLENKNSLQSNLHKIQGAIGSLNTLQQAALELNSSKLDWLAKNNIDPELLFFNQLNIEDGLEIPVAVVLNQYLDAILFDKPISEIEMETLEGKGVLTVPAGTQPGQVFRLQGKGMPIVNGMRRGDILAVAKLNVPTSVDKKYEDLMHQLSKLEQKKK